MPRGGEWGAVGRTMVCAQGRSRRPLGLFLPTHSPLRTRGTFWLSFLPYFLGMSRGAPVTRVPHGVSAPHVSPVLHTSASAYFARRSTCVPFTLAVSRRWVSTELVSAGGGPEARHEATGTGTGCSLDRCGSGGARRDTIWGSPEGGNVVPLGVRGCVKGRR
jgi:hypothetical protein